MPKEVAREDKNMTLKLNIGHKSGKTHKKDLTEEESSFLMGKKIGETVKGDSIGFPGYEFEFTGGSDNSGFPMRRDVNFAGKKRILITASTGFKAKRKGLRRRRTVAGNTIYKGTVQVNLKILKEGKTPLDAPAEEPAAEVPAEKAKEEPKAEEKPAEKPAEEPKAE